MRHECYEEKLEVPAAELVAASLRQVEQRYSAGAIAWAEAKRPDLVTAAEAATAGLDAAYRTQIRAKVQMACVKFMGAWLAVATAHAEARRAQQAA